MLKHLKGARIMQDCATGNLHIDAGTGGGCAPLNSFMHGAAEPTVVLPIQKIGNFTINDRGIAEAYIEGYFYGIFQENASYGRAGGDYIVHVDGVNYPCRMYRQDPIVLGNLALSTMSGPYTGETFCMVSFGGYGMGIYIAGTAKEHTFGITKLHTKTIDTNYLSDDVPCRRGRTILDVDTPIDFLPCEVNGRAGTDFIATLPYELPIHGLDCVRFTAVNTIGTHTCTLYRLDDGNGDLYFGDERCFGKDSMFEGLYSIRVADGTTTIFKYAHNAEYFLGIRVELIEDTKVPMELLDDYFGYDVVIETNSLSDVNRYGVCNGGFTAERVKLMLAKRLPLRVAVMLEETISGGASVTTTLPCYEIQYIDGGNIYLYFMYGSHAAVYGDVIFQAPKVYRLTLSPDNNGNYSVTSVRTP